MYGYTYLTYDTKRDMYYVGQHKSEAYDPKYLGSGNYIKRILKKRPETLRNYVLEWCETKDALDESEIRWIEYFREEMGADRCYNITDGGNITSGMRGRHHSEETKQVLSDINRGKKLPEEVKRKLSEVHKGHIVSQATREKISKKKMGHKYTDEQKRRISEATKLAMNNPDIKRKLSEVGRRNGAKTSKKVYKYDLSLTLIEIYASIKEASMKNAIGTDCISRCCSGIFQQSHGFIWSFTPIRTTKMLF